MADQVDELESNVLNSFKRLSDTKLIPRSSVNMEEEDAFGEEQEQQVKRVCTPDEKGVRVDRISASNLLTDSDRDSSLVKTCVEKRGQLETLVKDKGFLHELFGTMSWVQCDVELKDGICRFFTTVNGTYQCIGNLNFDLYMCRLTAHIEKKK